MDLISVCVGDISVCALGSFSCLNSALTCPCIHSFLLLHSHSHSHSHLGLYLTGGLTPKNIDYITGAKPGTENLFLGALLDKVCEHLIMQLFSLKYYLRTLMQ